MAQFTAHSRVKLLLNGDGGAPFGSEPKYRSRFKLRSVRTLKRRIIPLYGASTGISPSSSSSSSPSALRKSVQHPADGGDGAIVDLDYDYEFESDDLACFRGLVLDISYRPVNVVCWKRAICLEFMEKADVLEYYDQTVSSPSGSFNIPAVLRTLISLFFGIFQKASYKMVVITYILMIFPSSNRCSHLLQVVKRRRVSNTLSRKNILYRDNYTCQYCSSHESLTIDHVLPISRGGEWTWENLVAACVKCNSKKGHKTVDEANMKLKKTPKAPKEYDILAIPLTSTAIKMLNLRKGTPEEWRQYLSSEQ